MRGTVGLERAPVRVPFAAHWAARAGLHYAWVVVAATFLVVIAAAGVRAATSILIRPLEAEFGWTRAAISLALSVSLIAYGIAGPISGAVATRLGLRGMTLAFLALSTLGVALSAAITHLWQLHVFWGAVVGLGTGGIAMVLSAAVATAWFETRRGLVTGILGGASSAGQLVFLPLLIWINGEWGWRTAIVLLAVLLAVVVLPATLLLMRGHPGEVGLRPYGGGDSGPAAAPAAATDQRLTPMAEAVRTLDFWLLAITFAICGFTTVGIVGPHFIPHAVEHGFSEAQAAGVLGTIGAMNVVGTIASGWLCDRFSPRLLLAFYYVARALALLALPLITTMPLMSVFAIVFGFDFIATVPPTVLLTADRFGRRSVGTIFGWIWFAHMAGAAVATALAGAVHDAVGTYAPAIYAAGLLALVAGALAFGIGGRPARQPLTAAGD